METKGSVRLYCVCVFFIAVFNDEARAWHHHGWTSPYWGPEFIIPLSPWPQPYVEREVIITPQQPTRVENPAMANPPANLTPPVTSVTTVQKQKVTSLYGKKHYKSAPQLSEKKELVNKLINTNYGSLLADAMTYLAMQNKETMTIFRKDMSELVKQVSEFSKITSELDGNLEKVGLKEEQAQEQIGNITSFIENLNDLVSGKKQNDPVGIDIRGFVKLLSAKAEEITAAIAKATP